MVDFYGVIFIRINETLIALWKIVSNESAAPILL